ncbi:MAG: LuxR C-terminal-related transcriptional regulator [Pseudomonadota bacterium]
MRRVDQDKTHHGTAAGQVAADPSLRREHDLTDRQAQVAALLTAGVHPADLAVELGIAQSTTEKHLAALRDKMAAPDTLALCAMMAARRTPEQEIAFRCWQPVLPPDAEQGDHAALARQVQTASNLGAQLRHLRNHLAPYDIRHIYYAYVPLSVQGFLAGDIWDLFEAPDTLVRAFETSGGLMAQPMALALFNAPGDIATSDYSDITALPKSAQSFAEACQDHGAAAAIALGFPSGGGFVGLAMTVGSAEAFARIQTDAAQIRAAAMLVHGSALTGGTLAAMADLSVRERDALSALARGLESKAAAKELKVSDRAFGKLTASARRKLKADTTAAAIYKASALNALVFL